MHLADMGFKEISVEPVVGSGKDLYFKESDVTDILNEYENLAVQYLKRLSKGQKFRFYHLQLLYPYYTKFNEVFNCSRGIFIVEVQFHNPFAGINFCFAHFCIIKDWLQKYNILLKLRFIACLTFSHVTQQHTTG